MKVVAIVLVLVVVLLAFLALRALLRGGPREWELVERSQDGVYTVACRRGSEELVVGAVPADAEDFEYELEELRARARQRLIALEAPRGR